MRVPVLVPFGVAAAALLLAPSATAAPQDPAVVGRFSEPFAEPVEKCVEDEDGRTRCTPAAASVAMLPNGKVVYWDALEGMEDVDASVAAEYGHVAGNNPTRVLDLLGPPSWETPTPEDGGSNPAGNDGEERLPGVPQNDEHDDNDGDLFCSDQVFLSDGRVLVVGGTSYYLEPGVEEPDLGVTELEGIKNSRVFDASDNTWRQSGSMTYGRWYPTLVTLGDGRVFVASGVTKLIKPVYADRPGDSGTNVKQTEVYDPASGTWSVNPPSANRSLPLYPRLRLLPNGKVYYDAAGQTFNPNGQSYDEALWNLAAVYDPQKQTWRDLGVPFSSGGPPGFRGSTFSQMLPLSPPYDRAQFLAAGGVLGTTPGAYVGSAASALNTVTIEGDTETFTSEPTGPLAAPRWFPTGVTLPTGQVLAFSGADRDEVVVPGSGTPVRYVEAYDPESQTWSVLATQTQGRTYHNTAALLPDGRVLVGGHSPIATGYGRQDPTYEEMGLSSPYRDPTFEIYSPPYLFYGPRPVITMVDPAVRRGAPLEIGVTDADQIESVVLVRNTALTHLIDGDQRSVELAFTRTANGVRAQVPPSPNVLPPGPYLLFVNKRTDKGLTPSVSRQVFVGAPVPDSLAGTLAVNAARQTAEELDARDGSARPGAAEAAAPRAGRAGVLPATGGSLAPVGALVLAAALAVTGLRRRSRLQEPPRAA